jgi:hypothetical protein
MKKRSYIKPEITRIDIDNLITLQMQTQPKDPEPLGSSKKTPANTDPFASPFSDKPFN